LLREIFIAILESKEDSTPGIPLSSINGKKEFWLEDWDSISRLVLERMLLLLDDQLPNEPSELVLGGYRDPIYVFIKDEPHKLEKINAQRLRIISSVSLVDSLIERVLFSRQNKLEIKMCNYIPYKPGMGLDDDGQRNLFKWFQDRQAEYNICSTDIRAWDWSTPHWLLDFETKYRLRTGNEVGGWARLVRNYNFGLQRKVFQLPSGEMFEQTAPGIVPSGTYCTSSGNSHMRAGLSFVAQLNLGCDEEPRAEGGQMGDDALERYLEGLEEEYNKLGFVTKGVELKEKDHFSFCSTSWEGNWCGRPESWTKTLFRFLSKNPNDPLYSQWRKQLEYDLRHHNKLSELLVRVDEYMMSAVVSSDLS